VLVTFGFILLYLPGSPSALKWPFEWGILLAWTILGVFFFLVQRGGNTGLSAAEQRKLVLGDHDPAAGAQDTNRTIKT
jgi:hypothetical protein